MFPIRAQRTHHASIHLHQHLDTEPKLDSGMTELLCSQFIDGFKLGVKEHWPIQAGTLRLLQKS